MSELSLEIGQVMDMANSCIQQLDAKLEDSQKHIAELERKLEFEKGVSKLHAAEKIELAKQITAKDAQLKTLEEANLYLSQDVHDYRDKLQVCIEALKWYADDNNYDEGTGFLRGVSSVQSNAGWHATEALNKIGAVDETIKY